VPSATAVDIKDILVAAGVGAFASTTGWALAVSREPDEPNQVITVYDVGGTDPDPKFLLDFPSVQVRIRGNPADYVNTYARAQLVKDTLLGLQRQTVNATIYVGIWQTGDIQNLGFDDSNRPILVTNWRIAREPASGANRQAV